jgi:hypothetical protein
MGSTVSSRERVCVCVCVCGGGGGHAQRKRGAVLEFGAGKVAAARILTHLRSEVH